MLDVLLGGRVVGVIGHGLQLLGLTAAGQLMWTALVLVAAGAVDALTRRGRSTSRPGAWPARPPGPGGPAGVSGGRAPAPRPVRRPG
jgi:hypothetical protein